LAADFVFNDRVELKADEREALRALMNDRDTPAPVATRARIVLWRAEGRQKKEIAALAGVSRPTVDLWLTRYGTDGIAGLLDRPRGAGREQVPATIRARILAATRTSPPAETGLSHWSSREMAAFITRTEGVYVSHHYVAKLWRANGLKPHRQGTFKVSKDPAFAEKVADIVGLYLDPPAGAIVLSLTRRPRSKRWTGPSRCCRSRLTLPRSAPTTTSDTARRTCSPR
jgi:transposase